MTEVPNALAGCGVGPVAPPTAARLADKAEGKPNGGSNSCWAPQEERDPSQPSAPPGESTWTNMPADSSELSKPD